MIKNFINIFILLLLTVNIVAQKNVPLDKPDALKNKLKKQAKETTSIIASFTQEKQVSFMNKPQLSEGVFYYQQVDKMRWEQQKPSKYILLINSDKVRIKSNGKEENLKGANKIMGKINELMIGMINGEIFDSKSFITKYFTNGNNYIIELVPKNKQIKSYFNKIELSFSKKDTHLNQLTFFEKSGDKSVMKFFNQKFNQSIAPSIFLTL